MEQFPDNVVKVPAKLRHFYSSPVWHFGFYWVGGDVLVSKGLLRAGQGA